MSQRSRSKLGRRIQQKKSRVREVRDIIGYYYMC